MGSQPLVTLYSDIWIVEVTAAKVGQVTAAKVGHYQCLDDSAVVDVGERHVCVLTSSSACTGSQERGFLQGHPAVVSYGVQFIV